MTRAARIRECEKIREAQATARNRAAAMERAGIKVDYGKEERT